MPRAGFEPATPATKRPQTYALDRAATGIGVAVDIVSLNNQWLKEYKSRLFPLQVEVTFQAMRMLKPCSVTCGLAQLSR
jgi:hypothetical protein